LLAFRNLSQEPDLIHNPASGIRDAGGVMRRDGFEKIVSQAVSHALGIEIGLTSQGRASDGRHCFARPQKSECDVCCVPFLKKHVDSVYNHPCTVKERPYCRVRRLAQAISVLGSAQAAENKIESTLRSMGVSSEASLGRGNAYNMSIIVKIDEAGKARLRQLTTTAKQTRDEKKRASTLSEALDILSPAALR
jgi:hypothetical protein